MTRSFKSTFYTIAMTPGRTLFLLGAVFCILALLTLSLGFYLLALLFLVPCLIWQRKKRQYIGQNFLIMPSMPILDGKPYLFLCQRPRKNVKDLSCWHIQRSLIEDKQNIPAQLPKGNYCTITHESVLHILDKCDNITLDGEPRFLYTTTLRSILTAQTGGRCKRCKPRCRAWNTEARDFYLVRFTVF